MFTLFEVVRANQSRRCYYHVVMEMVRKQGYTIIRGFAACNWTASNFRGIQGLSGYVNCYVKILKSPFYLHGN